MYYPGNWKLNLSFFSSDLLAMISEVMGKVNGDVIHVSGTNREEQLISIVKLLYQPRVSEAILTLATR